MTEIRNLEPGRAGCSQRAVHASRVSGALRTARPTSKTSGLSKVVVLALALFSVGSQAQDWPQWGGTPERNMYSLAKGLPDHFTKGKSNDIKFKPGTEEIDVANVENLKWVAKLGSQSYGNVTVAKGRVFVGTNNETDKLR